MSGINFLIVSTGYNCSKYVLKAYHAMLNQTHEDFKAVIINDASYDDTNDQLSIVAGQDKRFKIYSCTENMGAAYRRWQAINELSNVDSETVIVLVGLDDYLKPDALETIAKEYESGVYMTYGNWVDNNGTVYPKENLYFDDETHESRSYRSVRYRSTSLNTFKKFLFDKVPKDEYMIEGVWMQSTTESHLMFSCLEMCGKDRIGVIEKPIYIYNKRKDSAALRYGRAYQDAVYSHVINMPKKKPYERS